MRRIYIFIYMQGENICFSVNKAFASIAEDNFFLNQFSLNALKAVQLLCETLLIRVYLSEAINNELLASNADFWRLFLKWDILY